MIPRLLNRSRAENRLAILFVQFRKCNPGPCETSKRRVGIAMIGAHLTFIGAKDANEKSFERRDTDDAGRLILRNPEYQP